MKLSDIIISSFLSILSYGAFAQSKTEEPKAKVKFYKTLDSLIAPLTKGKYDEFSYIFRIMLDFDNSEKLKVVKTSDSSPRDLYKVVDTLKILRINWKKVFDDNIRNRKAIITVYYMKERDNGSVLFQSADDASVYIDQFGEDVITEKERVTRYLNLSVHIKRFAGKNRPF
ncbi:hypothetical protein [Chitinophaga sp. OAE865]|uniref:hypothetical protein n=1 Tax=Chitinophaga sp. OAE865 TaxID=2817898 RepID=UPI001AE8A837